MFEDAPRLSVRRQQSEGGPSVERARLSRHLPRLYGRFVVPVLDCREETMMADVLVLDTVGPSLLLSLLESLDAQNDSGSLRECAQCVFVQVLYAFEKIWEYNLRVLHVRCADICLSDATNAWKFVDLKCFELSRTIARFRQCLQPVWKARKVSA